MPTYEYRCGDCDVRQERTHPMSYDGEIACPQCAGLMLRKPCPPVLAFKGYPEDVLRRR